MLSRLRDSLYIIYQKRLIVKGFSESFLKKFSSKNAYKLLIEGLAAASAAGQLAYYSNVYDYCQGLFLIFSTNFEGDFLGKVHIGDLLCDGHKLWYRVGCGPGMPGPYGVAGG